MLVKYIDTIVSQSWIIIRLLTNRSDNEKYTCLCNCLDKALEQHSKHWL